ncbi:MAG: ParA family protein, partial [Gammaproteobacteria bacterium]
MSDIKIVSVMMRKGGVGKTLFSVLLAQYFGLNKTNGKRVLLMDMDSQQNASVSLLKMESDPDLPEAFYPPIHPDYDAEEEGDEWEGRSSTADLFYGMPVVPYETRFPNLDILPAAGEQLQAVELVRSEEVKSKIYEQIRLFLDDPDLQSLYDM